VGETGEPLVSLAYIRDGLPVLDDPVAGHVYVIADNTTTIVAVFTRGPGSKWWDPFAWTDWYSERHWEPFGCGTLSIFHEGPDHPGERVLRIQVTHRLLDSWPTVASVLAGVLSREQSLELLDILHSPHDASIWGPWRTAIETGAEHPGG